ncbi:MAG: carboxypeptidase regulatory-like domain-containing protein [Candidatus Tectomicrobia bacterium]|nr:carboxypeptidase regulatory-like domain-containing protein [Candidatus Tectomicrobia bacterium]
MRIRTLFHAALAAVLALMFWLSTASAYAPEIVSLPFVQGGVIQPPPLSGPFHRLRWNLGDFPQGRVPFIVNPKSPPGGTLIPLPAPDTLFEIVRTTLNVWEDIPTATIKFNFSAPSDAPCCGKLDGINLITFADPLSDVGPGVVATTTVYAVLEAGPFHLPGTTIDTVIDFPGQLIETDFAFNPQVELSVTQMSNAIDIPGTMFHEIGHAIGLDHTAILTSTMFPFGDRGDLDVRSPEVDDVVGISATYPDESAFSRAYGSIRGSVTTTADAPVFGGHVVAEEASTGVAVVSAVSQPDGTYAIEGLPPGEYRLFVEPLDGPVRPTSFDLGSIFTFSPDAFKTKYRDGTATVTAGNGLTGIDISGVIAEDPTLNLTKISRVGVFDLAGGTVFFIPRPSGGFEVTLDAPAGLDSSFVTEKGTGLGLDDDDSQEVAFSRGFTFPFYGATHSSIFVNSNGVLTFSENNTSFPESKEEFLRFRQPSIAPLFVDLNPGVNGVDVGVGADVFAKQEAARFIVTYWELPQFGGTATSTFQVVLHAQGVIQFTYQDVSATNGMFGVSPGGDEVSAAELNVSVDAPFTSEPGRAVLQTFFNLKQDAGVAFEQGGSVIINLEGSGLDASRATIRIPGSGVEVRQIDDLSGRFNVHLRAAEDAPLGARNVVLERTQEPLELAVLTGAVEVRPKTSAPQPPPVAAPTLSVTPPSITTSQPVDVVITATFLGGIDSVTRFTITLDGVDITASILAVGVVSAGERSASLTVPGVRVAAGTNFTAQLDLTTTGGSASATFQANVP